MSKIIILISILSCSTCSVAQNKFFINSILGFNLKINERELPSFPEAWRLDAHPRLGFEAGKINFPLTFSLSKTFFIEPITFPDEKFTIAQTEQEIAFDINYYLKKNSRLGIGFYSKKVENAVNFIAPSVSRGSSGLAISDSF